MARRDSTRNIIMIFGIFLTLILVFSQGWLDDLGIPTDLEDKFIAIFPGFIIVVFSVVGLAYSRDSPMLVGGMTLTGIGFAVLESELVDIGLLVVGGNLGDWNLNQLQLLSIIGGLILGVVVYASKK